MLFSRQQIIDVCTPHVKQVIYFESSISLNVAVQKTPDQHFFQSMLHVEIYINDFIILNPLKSFPVLIGKMF